MADIDELLRLFAQCIFVKAKALNNLELSATQRKRLRASITAEIRTCGGLIYPEFRAPEVSEAARLEAERIPVMIFKQSWHTQPTFDARRKVFHWEHVDPVARIQEACENAKSEVAIFQVLKTRLRIAWILKSENLELDRLGFKSKRPDPEAAYQAAKIVLVRLKG